MLSIMHLCSVLFTSAAEPRNAGGWLIEMNTIEFPI